MSFLCGETKANPKSSQQIPECTPITFRITIDEFQYCVSVNYTLYNVSLTYDRYTSTEPHFALKLVNGLCVVRRSVCYFFIFILFCFGCVFSHFGWNRLNMLIDTMKRFGETDQFTFGFETVEMFRKTQQFNSI